MKTINDIVREVAAEMLNTSMQEITADRIHGWATRLGATCKESLQVGNAAAKREALEAVVKVGYPHNFQREAPHIRSYCYEITTAIEKCFAALSAPARNCDKCLTAKDAILAHLEEVYEGEKVNFGDYEWCEFVKWLFAEAKGK